MPMTIPSIKQRMPGFARHPYVNKRVLFPGVYKFPRIMLHIFDKIPSEGGYTDISHLAVNAVYVHMCIGHQFYCPVNPCAVYIIRIVYVSFIFK